MFSVGLGGVTVDVISAEQLSQMYFNPPSVPRDIVFFLMTPIFESSTLTAYLIS